ncbi:MAG: glycosyltransferase family 2 protein [Ignavibacteria bacterium]|nr:glycosyltransferase family 2 protein [Ignavibacteria bacterium]
MLLSLIYVNYNTSGHLLTSIESILKLKSDVEYEVIVVDNNSPDKSALSGFEKKFNNIKIIYNIKNEGFGEACNIGAAASDAPYVCFVNPDIIFLNGFFRQVIDFIDKNDSAGTVGVSLIDPDGCAQYSFNDFPDMNWEISELFGNTDILIQQKLKKTGNNPLPIDWVIGAFMFMRKSVFNDVNGFDSDYFLYYEDTDLQRRIRSKGYTNYLLPYIKLIHGTKSSIQGDEGNKAYNFMMNKSKMIYFYKHSTFVKRNLVRLVNILRILSRIVLFPVKLSLNKSSSGDLKILFENLKIYMHSKEFYFK